MVEWVVSTSGVTGVGRAGAVRIEATDWRPDEADHRLPTPVDATVSGSATGLRLPTTEGTLKAGATTYDLATTRSLPGATFTLTVDDGVETTVTFSGPARLAHRGGETDIRFDTRRPITVGFREQRHRPPTLRVPRTPEGIATAITYAASAGSTTGPERSHPANRDHPPLVQFGSTAIPQSVRDRTPDTGIEFRVPADFGDLFVVAPLAYYAGARVTTGVESPDVRLPDGRVVAFPSGEAFPERVATTLRRLFFFDCFVRDTEGPGELVPANVDSRDELATYAVSEMGDRLGMVLDGRLAGLEERLPAWGLSTYVDPDPEKARALPYLLDRLSLVYPPSASQLDGQSLLERTLEDFYRGRGEPEYRASGGEVATAERLDPDLREGHVHAWLADGIPITACKASTRAYENRLRHERSPRERLTVDVVLNDTEMLEERTVADIYRERAADLPVEVTVHESLTRRELAAVFESETDFVHYVGHCEVSGLKCSDGYLPTAGLDVGARTFFLNACGSYREGLGLVEGGAGAGAVTLTKVLNEQAARVGTAFAQLLTEGFGIERALSLARRQILMGQDYAVVGDGTYRLVPSDGDPALLRITGGPDEYDVSYEVTAAGSAGRSYKDPFGDASRLHGIPSVASFDRDGLRTFLRGRDLPVLLDGTLYRSQELATTFGL